MKITDRKKLLEEIASFKSFKYVPKDIVPGEYLNDRQFVAEAIRLNPYFYEIIPQELRDDKELILSAAVELCYLDMNFDKKLLDDGEFLLKLLSVNGSMIRVIDRSKIDREILLTAIAQDYTAAAYIPYELRRDREFALEVSRLQGRALLYLTPEFRDDEEIVYNCVTSYRAFEFASNRLKNDDAFLMRVLEKNPSCLAYAPKSYRTDRQLGERLMKIHPYVYRYVQGELKNDLNYALKAVGLYPELYSSVPYFMRKSKEFTDGLERLIAEGNLSEKTKDYFTMIIRVNRGEYGSLFKSVITIVPKDGEE